MTIFEADISSISVVIWLHDKALHSCSLVTESLESIPFFISSTRFMSTSYPITGKDVDSWQNKGSPTYPRPTTAIVISFESIS